MEKIPILPFADRLQYLHPSLKVSRDYKPLLPAEILYGLDWDNRHQIYNDADIRRVESQLHASVERLKANPKFVVQRVERHYRPLTEYLPAPFRRDLADNLDAVDEMKKEGSVIDRLEQEFPGTLKSMEPRDIVDKSWGAIRDVVKKDRPLASVGDTANVVGQVLEGLVTEPLNRVAQGGKYVSELFKGHPETEAFAKAKELYQTQPVRILRPGATAEPTVLGDLARQGLEKVGGWVNKGIEEGSRAVVGHFGEGLMSPETQEMASERVAELLGGALGAAPLVSVAGTGLKMAQRALKKPGAPLPKPPSPLTESLEGIAEATDVPTLLEGAEKAPAIQERNTQMEPLRQALKGVENDPSLERVFKDLPDVDRLPPEVQQRVADALRETGPEATQLNLAKELADVPLHDVPSEGSFAQQPLAPFKGLQEVFDPLANLPDKEAYLEARGAYQGISAGLGRVTAPLIKELRQFPQKRREEIFKAIDNQTGWSLSANEYEVMNKIKEVNNSLGETLVERGYLDPGDFANLKGNYMPHLYLDKFFEAQNVPSPGGSGGGIQMNLSRMKERERLSLQTQMEHGLIRDAGVAFESYAKDAGRIVSADNLLNTIVSNPKWVWKDSIIPDLTPATGKQSYTTIGELPGLIKVQRQVVEGTPPGEGLTAALQRLEQLEKISKEKGAPPLDFTPVPNTPGYGPLRGLYVHKGIANDIAGFFTPASQIEATSPMVRAMAEFAQNSIGAWKVAKTVLNIPAWFRNFGEAAVRLNLSGVDYSQMPGLYWKAATEMKRHGPLYREAEARGLLSSTFSEAELRPAMNLIKEWVRDPEWFRTMASSPSAFARGLPAALYRAPLALGTKIANFATQVYQSGDSLMVLAKYISERQAGKNATQAFHDTIPWNMDYSLASPLVKTGRRFVFPFLSYPVKVTPVLLKAVEQNPERFVKYGMAPYIYSNIMDKLAPDVRSEEARALIDIYPKTVRQYGTSFLLPTRTPTGNLTLVNADYFFPWGGLTDAARSLTQGDIRGASRMVALGNPILDLYSMIATSRDGMLYDAFTGRPLYNPLDSVTARTLKTTGKLAESFFMPPFLTSSGALGKALTLTFDEDRAAYKDLSWRDVALSMLGVTTHPVSPESQRRLANGAMRELGESWNNYQQNTTDPPEVVAEKEQEYREGMLLLQHPESRRPKGMDPERYNLLSRTPEETALSNPEVLIDKLVNPKNREQLLFNLPTTTFRNTLPE